MDLVVNDMYEVQAPAPENLVALFEGQWVSALPGLPSGDVPLFSDDRIQWAIDLAGGVTGKRVLELGPLEGGHSHMLEQAGAAHIDAIEANTLCYLKCLLVQQLFGLARTRFELGNFVPWLLSSDETYDVVVAAGVLYHLSDPVPVLDDDLPHRRPGLPLDPLRRPRADAHDGPSLQAVVRRGGGARLPRYAVPLAPARVQEEPDPGPEVHRRCAHHHGLDREADDPRRVRGARLRVEIAHEADNHSGPSASFFAQKPVMQ